MKEGDFLSKLVDGLKARKAKTFKIHGHAMQEIGIPDLYIAYQGRQAWVELKTETRKVEPWQQRQIMALRAAGAVAFVCRYKDATLTFDDTITLPVITLVDTFLQGWQLYVANQNVPNSV